MSDLDPRTIARRRFNVCPLVADLVASLAGLGPNQRAA